MELTQKKIYEDIEEIKNTIDCAKRQFSGFYRLFFAYGIIRGVVFILNLLSAFVFSGNSLEAYFNFMADICAAIAVAGIFVRVYRRERDCSNRYYLSSISIWGLIAVAMPFLMFAARLVITFSGVEVGAESLTALENYKMIINMLLVCAAMISVAYVIDKRWIAVLAFVVLFGFILAGLFPHIFISIPINHRMMQIGIAAIICLVVNILGYIVLGFLLLSQEKKNGNRKHTGGV